MKNQLLLLFMMAVTCYASAQDIIIKKTGDEINSKVIEITADAIKYKAFENQEGPLRNIALNDVFMIIYENGKREIFKQNVDNASTSNQAQTTTHQSPAQTTTQQPVQQSTEPEDPKAYKKKRTARNAVFLAPSVGYVYPFDIADGIKILDLPIVLNDGYFVAKNLAITTTLGAEYTKTTIESSSYRYYNAIKGKYVTSTTEGSSSSSTAFIYGAGIKYYIGGRLMVGSSLISAKVKDYDAVSYAHFELGYAIFISKHCSLEPSVQYVMGLGDADGYSAVQGNLAFGIYF